MAFVINGDPGTRRAPRPGPRQGKTRRKEGGGGTNADTNTPNAGGKHTLTATVELQMEMFWMRVAF